MVLFGKEFYADEGAEVGGGDGLGKTEDCDVASDLRHRVLTAREQCCEHVFPISLKKGRYFVSDH
jgi:hypothetical protein